MNNEIEGTDSKEIFFAELFNEGLYYIDGEQAGAPESEKGDEDHTGRGDGYSGTTELFTAEEPAASPGVDSGGIIDYTGQYDKELLIVTEYSRDHHISVKDKLFLINYLKAIGLSLKDVAIINIQASKNEFREIMGYLEPKTLLLFGVSKQFIPAELYQQGFIQYNGVNTIVSPALSDIAGSRKLKGILWEHTKRIFHAS